MTEQEQRQERHEIRRDEREEFEASIWGQTLRVSMASIIPLLLIALLGVNTYVLVQHSHGMSTDIYDMAQEIVKETRQENALRAREHAEITKLINAVVDNQNTMFLAAIHEKSRQDSAQHLAIERALTKLATR